MTPTKSKHTGESWVVTANRERDRLAEIKSRERIERVREEFRNLYIGMYELTDEQMADLPILDPSIREPVSVVKDSEKGLDRDEPNV